MEGEEAGKAGFCRSQIYCGQFSIMADPSTSSSYSSLLLFFHAQSKLVSVRGGEREDGVWLRMAEGEGADGGRGGSVFSFTTLSIWERGWRGGDPLGIRHPKQIQRASTNCFKYY